MSTISSAFKQLRDERKQIWKDENYPFKEWEDQAITDRLVFDGDTNITDETVEDKWDRYYNEVVYDEIYNEMRDEYIQDRSTLIWVDFVFGNDGETYIIDEEEWTYKNGSWISSGTDNHFNLIAVKRSDNGEVTYHWMDNLGEDALRDDLDIDERLVDEWGFEEYYHYYWSGFAALRINAVSSPYDAVGTYDEVAEQLGDLFNTALFEDSEMDYDYD